MYTQCPECLTIYEIDEDALQASLGIVHCGHCAKRFDALRTLSDTLPVAPLAPLPEQDPAARAPTLTEAVPPSAYELAARKRRARDDDAPDTTAGQHELDLEPSTLAVPADTNESPRTSSDDWFADLETELTAASTTESPDTTAPDADIETDWTIESSDEIDSETLDIYSAPPVATDSGDTEAGLEAQAPAAEIVPPLADDSGLQREAAPDTLDSGFDPGIESITGKAGTPSVVSPRLLEGDVFDTEADAFAAPVEYASEDLDADAPATNADEISDAAAEADLADIEAATESATTDPSAPVYVRPNRRRVSAAGLAWAAGCLVLALALAAQLAWTNRVELVRDPATRAWMAGLCRNVPCRLPPIKDTAQLELLSRDVRPDPNAAGALTITATVRNNATFRQPWPVVKVELTDVDNHPVAMRRFRPVEYMPDPAQRAAGIAPGATAALAFEVADPGKNASGFRFGFE